MEMENVDLTIFEISTIKTGSWSLDLTSRWSAIHHAGLVGAIPWSFVSNAIPAVRYTCFQLFTRWRQVVAWLSASALISINAVTLRRARLILGWVTVCWRLNHLGM